MQYASCQNSGEVVEVQNHWLQKCEEEHRASLLDNTGEKIQVGAECIFILVHKMAGNALEMLIHFCECFVFWNGGMGMFVKKIKCQRCCMDQVVSQKCTPCGAWPDTAVRPVKWEKIKHMP